MKKLLCCAAMVPVAFTISSASAEAGEVTTDTLPPLESFTSASVPGLYGDLGCDPAHTPLPAQLGQSTAPAASGPCATPSPSNSASMAAASAPLAARGISGPRSVYMSTPMSAPALTQESGGSGGAPAASTAPDISSASGGGGAPSAEDLVNQSNNPASTLVSVPIQPEFNFRSGPYRRTKFDTQLKPVIPIKINDSMNFVAHPTLMFYSDPRRSPQTGRKTGLGNLTFVGWFTNAKPYKFLSGNITIGPGPALQIPTRSTKWVDTKKFGLGPSVVYIWTKGSVMVGGFSYLIFPTGHINYKNKANSRSFVSFFLATYSFKSGFYYVYNPTFTKTWPNRGHRSWTVPVGGGVGQVFSVGKQKMKGTVQAYYNAARPYQGARWQLRFELTFLFPKG